MPADKQKVYYETVQQAVAELNSPAELSELLDVLVSAVAHSMEVAVSIVLLDSSRTKLVHSCSHGLPQYFLQKGVVDVGKSLGETIDGEVIVVQDTQNDPRLQYPESLRKAGITSVLGVPLIVERQSIGGIRVYARETRVFSAADISFVKTMARIMAELIRCHSWQSPATGQPVSSPENRPTVLQQTKKVVFAHPSEKEFARLLDFYHIEWVYEPRAFPLYWEDQKVTEMFTPDFYLPSLDLYIELTTLRQSLVTRKNRKLRRLRELHPEIKIALLYRKDFERLLAKYGLGPLAETRSRSVNQVLHSQVEIQQRIQELAAELTRDYHDRHPVLVGVLRGVFYFMADLTRSMPIPLDIEFMAISYFSDQDNAAVKITRDLGLNITGRHVIVVEDIVDTGMTLGYIIQHLKLRQPASIAVCTLLDKRVRRIAEVPLKYIGFEVPDEFLVGYGLDYKEEYRNLPFIGILESGASPQPLAAPAAVDIPDRMEIADKKEPSK